MCSSCNHSDDLNDDLSDLLGGAARNTAPVAPKAPPASYKPVDFSEPCPKCRGRGRFISYSGRDIGPCFNCKGAGKKTYKQSPEKRAQARVSSAARRDRVAAEKAEGAAAAAKEFSEANPHITAWLIANNGKFDFATSLGAALVKYGSLTAGQIAAVEKCIARDADRAKAREDRVANAPAVDATKIEQAFAIAREKAARPGQMGTFTKPLKLTSPSGVTLTFRPGSIGSQWEGMLFVKTDDGKKLGSIKGGKFVRRFECTDAEAEAVIACASDPETAVVAYAKAWSRCGVCGRGLLNDVSIARGIGPICAEKFGW